MTSKNAARKDLEFELIYSYYYEKLMYKFFGRLDKLLSLILLFTATSVIASAWNGVLLGSIIALVTCIQFIYAPGAKYHSAKEAYREYSRLQNHLDEYDDEALRLTLSQLSRADTDEIGLLSHPARLAALASQGISNLQENVKERPLTKAETLIAHFAGEYPEYQFRPTEKEKSDDKSKSSDDSKKS